jgi:hypothetical protein
VFSLKFSVSREDEEEVSGQRSKVIREEREKTMDYWILDNLGRG